MFFYFSCFRNFYSIRKALPIILLPALILTVTFTYAEQYNNEILDKKSNPSSDISNAITRQSNSDKKPKKKVNQSLSSEQTEKRFLRRKNRKAGPKPVQEKLAQNTKQSVSSKRLIDKATNEPDINKQKLIKTTAQSKKSIEETVSKQEKTTLKSAKTEISDLDNDRTKVLDKDEIVAEAPKAKNVDLEKPISESDIVPPAPVEKVSDTKPETTKKDKAAIETDSVAITNEPKIEEQVVIKVHDKPFLLLGAEVPPATSTRLAWSPSQSFKGISAPTPVLVVNGAKAGPVLCLTAAIHGDELNGIEIVRRVLYNLDINELSGTVIGVPIVNLQGFRRTSRYLSDRRDLNRFFPGNTDGSSASRIAYSFFHEIIVHCNALVDLHTGSFHRTNLPQLRADLKQPAVVGITQGFGATVILQSTGAKGTLRRAAVDAGIPAVTLEAGEPMRLQEEQVSHGVKGIHTLLNQMGMYDYSSFWGDPEPVYYKSKWVRANQGGILFSQIDLGKKVKKGDILGSITDPITNVRKQVTSPFQGRIIGMALNQVVMPGFAAFHIGIETTEEEVTDKNADLADASAKQQASEKEKNQENVVEIQKKILKVDGTENLEDSE